MPFLDNEYVLTHGAFLCSTTLSVLHRLLLFTLLLLERQIFLLTNKWQSVYLWNLVVISEEITRNKMSRNTSKANDWFGLLGFNASATARVISRRWNDDEISFLVEETGVPGGNHRPTASNWWNFSHIGPLPSPGIELGPQRCEAKWAKARWERRLSSPSYRGP